MPPYLLTIIMGVFAEVVVRGAVVVRDDAAATAMNILKHESLYRAGLAADLVMLLCYVVVTLLLQDSNSFPKKRVQGVNYLR